MGYFRTSSLPGTLFIAVLLALSTGLTAQGGLLSYADSSLPDGIPVDYSWYQINSFASPGWFENIYELPPGSGPFLMTGNSANDGGGLVTIILNPPSPNSDVLTPEPGTAWLAGMLLLGFGARRLMLRGELPKQGQELRRS